MRQPLSSRIEVGRKCIHFWFFEQVGAVDKNRQSFLSPGASRERHRVGFL